MEYSLFNQDKYRIIHTNETWYRHKKFLNHEDIDNLKLGVEDNDFDPKSITELYLKPLKEILDIISESLSSFKSLNKIFKI